MLLALETSTNVCSVAFKDDEGAVHEKRTEKRGSHSEKLFLFIEELMETQQFSIQNLDAVLVSEGPGSYTGLRIAASAVKGLLFQSDIPLYAINTLAGFAQAAVDHQAGASTVHAVIDARRVHLYHQKFLIEGSQFKAENDVGIRPIEEVQEKISSGDIIVGTGISRLEELITQKSTVMGPERITARSLIALFDNDASHFVKQVDPESFDPNYYTSRQVDK